MHSRAGAISLTLPRKYASDDNKLYAKINFYVSAHPRRDLSEREQIWRESRGSAYNTTSKSSARFYPFFFFFSIPRDSQATKLSIIVQNRFIKAYFLTPSDLFAPEAISFPLHSAREYRNSTGRCRNLWVWYSFTFAPRYLAHLRHVLFVEIKTIDIRLVITFFSPHFSTISRRSIRNRIWIIIFNVRFRVTRCA